MCEETDLADAARLAELIGVRVAAAAMDPEGSGGTLSLAVAEAGRGETANDLVDRADAGEERGWEPGGDGL